MALTDVNLFRIDGTLGTVENISTESLNGGPLAGTRNRIINGDMRIDQRNAGASVTQNTAGIYTVDRWLAYGAVTSKFTIQQNAGSVTPPAGFTNYLGCTSSSAYTVGAAEGFTISQQIEGFNTADLGWGAAGAASVTLSFWVRSSLTGTFSGVLQNSAQNRSYPFTYTISAANTWEQKSVTIIGDTTGTWLKDNGIGIRVYFSLGAGSTWSATAGSWTSSFALGATGATSIVSTNGATFYITGVQLEAGTVATPFERRSYGQELALCQRYCFAITGNNQTFSTISYGNATSVLFNVAHPVTMRTTASVTAATGTNYYAAVIGGTVDYVNSLSFYTGSPTFTSLLNNTEASGTGGQAGYGTTNSASSTIFLTAEL